MFAKLLKHEWRATRGIVALLCVIILISGVTIGGVMYYMLRTESQQSENVSLAEGGFAIVVEEEDAAMSDLAMVLCMVLLSCGIVAIAVCCAAVVFFLVYRFYKRCFTDEGYLTFTLPVSNHQILLSSIVNCIIGTLLVILAAALAVAIIFGMFLLAINSIQTILWADVWTAWNEVWQQLRDSFVKNIDQLALLGFSSIASALGSLICLMLSVTVGAMLARKYKILAAVGVYYGISMVESFVFSMVAFSASTTQNTTSLLAAPGIMSLLIAVAGYFLMHWLTSRKLNLV